MPAEELFFWMNFVKDALVAQCGHREKERAKPGSSLRRNLASPDALLNIIC